MDRTRGLHTNDMVEITFDSSCPLIQTFFERITEGQWYLLTSGSPDDTTKILLAQLLLEIQQAATNTLLAVLKNTSVVISEEQVQSKLSETLTQSFAEEDAEQTERNKMLVKVLLGNVISQLVKKAKVSWTPRQSEVIIQNLFKWIWAEVEEADFEITPETLKELGKRRRRCLASQLMVTNGSRGIAQFLGRKCCTSIKTQQLMKLCIVLFFVLFETPILINSALAAPSLWLLSQLTELSEQLHRKDVTNVQLNQGNRLKGHLMSGIEDHMLAFIRRCGMSWRAENTCRHLSKH
ncbi:uncharacterized protein LOC121898093 [Scomber scombrus]|uniref:Uncharacterized protein LOC121898093 n=1 Tax=Scomber scombrus TaxID=13677 RepID=A0AAV1P163_SCOSC